jgi:hypothetical protein
VFAVVGPKASCLGLGRKCVRRFDDRIVRKPLEGFPLAPLGATGGKPFMPSNVRILFLGRVDGAGGVGLAPKQPGRVRGLKMRARDRSFGRDPASRLRDLRGSLTPAKAGGVEPDPATPDAPGIRIVDPPSS